jgi:hypothetical protein
VFVVEFTTVHPLPGNPPGNSNPPSTAGSINSDCALNKFIIAVAKTKLSKLLFMGSILKISKKNP